MEHGLLMLAGEGIYRLEDRWYPVKAGGRDLDGAVLPAVVRGDGQNPGELHLLQGCEPLAGMKAALAILATALFLSAAAPGLRADDGGRTVFPGSLAPVPAQAHDLTAAEPVAAGETVTFQIALRLPPDGTAPEADYQTLVHWLHGQGLSINAGAFPQHTEIEATGTVDQVGKTLDVRFGRVEVDGRSYVAAVSAPSLPTALGGAVIGINGLQPFLRMHPKVGTAPERRLYLGTTALGASIPAVGSATVPPRAVPWPPSSACARSNPRSGEHRPARRAASPPPGRTRLAVPADRS